MKRKIAIKASSLPPRSPIGPAALYWLLLDRLDAPTWLYGVIGTLVILAAINWAHCFCTTEERDVPGFGEKKS